MQSESIRIGHIQYINTLPLFWRLLKFPLKNVNLVSGVPAKINELFFSKKLDMAMVSTLSWIENGGDDTVLLPEFCLKNHGGVLSVVLISKYPWEHLNQKRIGLTRSSQTSAFILKALLQQYEHYENDYIDIHEDRLESLQHCDALLLIGDSAINAPRQDNLYYYDLGEIWMNKTGHPIVFAVSVIKNDLDEMLLQSIILECRRSLVQFLENPVPVYEMARERISNADFDLEHYFSRLNYMWDEGTVESIEFMKSVYQRSFKS